MTRTPLAMRTLIRQTEALRSNVETETLDLDGLGVYRTVAFDPDTSEWLEPLAEVFASDPRIEKAERNGSHVYVTFVADQRADRAKPDFSLVEIENVLNEAEQAENASLVERREERRKELNEIAVADLREEYEYPEGDKTPKAEIINAILANEGFGTA